MECLKFQLTIWSIPSNFSSFLGKVLMFTRMHVILHKARSWGVYTVCENRNSRTCQLNSGILCLEVVMPSKKGVTNLELLIFSYLVVSIYIWNLQILFIIIQFTFRFKNFIPLQVHNITKPAGTLMRYLHDYIIHF